MPSCLAQYHHVLEIFHASIVAGELFEHNFAEQMFRQSGSAEALVIVCLFFRATPYPTIKLMLVGHSGKGKSTLLDNLRREGTGAYQHHAYPQRFPDRMRNEPGEIIFR